MCGSSELPILTTWTQFFLFVFFWNVAFKRSTLSKVYIFGFNTVESDRKDCVHEIKRRHFWKQNLRFFFCFPPSGGGAVSSADQRRRSGSPALWPSFLLLSFMLTCSEPADTRPAQLYLQFTELLHSLTQGCNLEGIKEQMNRSRPERRNRQEPVVPSRSRLKLLWVSFNLERKKSDVWEQREGVRTQAYSCGSTSQYDAVKGSDDYSPQTYSSKLLK